MGNFYGILQKRHLTEYHLPTKKSHTPCKAYTELPSSEATPAVRLILSIRTLLETVYLPPSHQCYATSHMGKVSST